MKTIIYIYAAILIICSIFVFDGYNARCDALADGATAVLRKDGIYCQITLSDGQVRSGKLDLLEEARERRLDLQNDPRYYPAEPEIEMVEL